MRGRLAFTTYCVSLLVCADAGAATPLNIKPGLWEVVRVTEQSAAAQISQARVDTLTPEQRKELESEFPERVPGRRQVDQTCITPQQLQIGFLPEDNPECLRTPLEQTDTTFAVRMDCLDSRGARKMNLSLTAPGPERVSGVVDGDIRGASGKVAHFKVSIEARWLKDDCEKHDAAAGAAAAEAVNPPSITPPDTAAPPG